MIEDWGFDFNILLKLGIRNLESIYETVKSRKKFGILKYISHREEINNKPIKEEEKKTYQVEFLFPTRGRSSMRRQTDRQTKR